MGENSKISWTNHTFNPWWGCVKVSDECDNCYAESWARRCGYSEIGKHFPIWGKDTRRRFFSDKHWIEPLAWDRLAEKAGERHRVFCGSMCDIMEDVANNAIAYTRERVYDIIQRTSHLDWLLLTKRPQNFRRFLPKAWLENPRPSVWGMTTVGVRNSLWRIDELRKAPFAVRGLSVEPLLEDLGDVDLTGIHWVIVGGESGPGARPFDLAWARDLRDQCEAAGSAFFMKQMGSRAIDTDYQHWGHRMRIGDTNHEYNRYIRVEFKDRAGAEPDEWPEDLRIQQMPEVQA